MGADGWLRIAKAEEFQIEFPDVDPADLGLRAETILNTKCLIAYNDTSDHDDMDDTWSPLGFTKARELERQRSRLRTIHEKGENGRYQSEFIAKQRIPAWLETEAAEKIAAIEADPALPYSQRCEEAYWWFERYAERIMCWT